MIIENGLKYIEMNENPYYYLYVAEQDITEAVINENTKVICDYAFFCCKDLTHIEIPNGVEVIDTKAFSGCSNLKSVVIGSNVIKIEDYTFEDCTNLINIFIPKNVKFIGQEVFMNCPNLIISCEEEQKPECWDLWWNRANSPVVWGYKKNKSDKMTIDWIIENSNNFVANRLKNATIDDYEELFASIAERIHYDYRKKIEI